MGKLDDIVVSEITSHILEQQHLQEGLRSAAFSERLICLSYAHAEIRGGLLRLLERVEEDLMDEDRNMREHLALLKVKWDDLHRQIADVQKQISAAAPRSP